MYSRRSCRKGLFVGYLPDTNQLHLKASRDSSNRRQIIRGERPSDYPPGTSPPRVREDNTITEVASNSRLHDGIVTGIFDKPVKLTECDLRRWKLALEHHQCLFEEGRKGYKDYVSNCIPNFPQFNMYKRRNLTFYTGLSIVGLVYGGLHCLAWNAPFSSEVEMIL